jgi:mRNA interferase MazF
MTTASRGQIYWIDYGGDRGTHPYVVVSNNVRNQNLTTVLGAMVTSTDKSNVPSAVLLTHLDTLTGSYVVADIIDELQDYEVAGTPAGYVSAPTMAKIDAALKHAFGLT